jgi:monoamine oxidase
MNSADPIVIVGAGAAGIAAARTLLAAKRDVIVLEARDRPGGRAAVDHRLGVPADRGAAWLHFANTNPFARLARDGGFSIDEREPDWGPRSRIGGVLPPAAEIAAWQASLTRYYGAIEAAAREGRDIALTEVLPQDELRARFDAVMTWAVGAESREISTVDLDNYAEGGPNWAVVEGLGAVVAHSAEGLPIHFGVEVTRIDRSGAALQVHSAAGVLAAAAVIVTVPTSALATGRLRFEPPLPESHRRAIEGLPLGVVNKVFFRFDDADLPPEPQFTIGTGSSTRTAHHQLRPATQPLVMSYFGGDLSKELEAASGLAAFARDELRSIFGADFIARIRGEFATAWRSDPHACGSYSVARPGCAAERAALSLPVDERLLFAGEACSRTQFGTLPGAWESGVAAAQHLLRQTGSAGVQRGEPRT